MTTEEELIHLREQAGLHQETVGLQQERITLRERELSVQQEQLSQFTEQVKAPQARLAEDSHNSCLPPSSDRFSRQPKSLHKKSGKESGIQ